MNLYNETKDILKKYNIVANKKLGQNFLINDDVINTIIMVSNISTEDLIIEIGPGLRNINEEIIRKLRQSCMYRIRYKNDKDIK